MSALASQLSKGVLNEMKTRILTSNIKKEKLKLTDSSQSMTEFFERENTRYETRKQNTKKKLDKIELYRQMIRELVQANLSLAAKYK
jgi:tellurite resistance protein